MEQDIKLIIGDLIVQNTMLKHQLAGAQNVIAELQTKVAELTPPPPEQEAPASEG